MTPRSTHTWNNTLVLLPLFALVAGCPADDEPAAAAPTTCTRPSSSATDGVYVSAHGADGCSTDTFCYVPKALTTGKCYENGTVCIPDQPDGRIDGQKYFSEYCLDEQSCLWSEPEAMGECVTGSGGSSGAAGSGGSSTGGTAGTAGSSGSGGSAVGGQGGSSGGAAGTGGSGGNVIPNEPLANVLTNGTIQMCGPDSIDFQVSALPQEVIRMRGTWTVPPGESGGLPAAEVWRLGEVVLFENNPVGFSPGLLGANSPPTSAEVVFSFYMGGPLNLRFFNTPPGCGTLSFVASFESERMGPNNYTKTTATPIDVPETINHHRGCEEERWYKFNANAGETHRLAFRGRVYPGWYYPTAYFGFTVEDETGPLPFAGSDLSFGGELKAGASLGDPIVLDQLFETTGTYYLHTPIDLPGCGLVEYEVTDTVL